MDRVRRLAAAQATLAAEIKARSRRLWSVSLFAGRTSLDKIVGTELQATWAGALWLRRPIRRQLGAQLLMGAASTPEQWAYGVVMWALGAGDRPDRVYAMAEPFLDQAGSDFVVRTLAEAEVAPKYGHRFLSVAAEAWDGVSDDALRWCVERVEPSAGDDPDALLTQAVWAGYAVRLEDEWHQRFADLSEDVRIAQVERLGADAVRHLSAANRRHVFDVASSAVLRQEPASAQLLRVLASAGSGSLAVSLRDAIRAKMSASVIAQLADEERGVLLDSGDVLRARDTLMAWVKEEATEAAQGQVSFGGTDTRVLLGRAVAATSEASADAVAVLMKLATDGGAPGEHIMNARIALTTVRRAPICQCSLSRFR